MGTVSRQPQTGTKPADGAPFVRLSRQSFNRGYDVASLAFGALVNQPIKPVGGWLRYISLTVKASGGVNGSVTVAAAADAPWNVIQTLLFRDPLGQPIINCDGYSLFELNKYSGQCGQGLSSDPSQRPSFSAISTGGSGTGNFTFVLTLPFELDSAAYCALSSLNAAATVTMDIQLAASSAVYTTPPGTLPTLEVKVEQAFWAVPVQDPSLAPPDAGASAQWTKTGGSSTVPSATNVLIASPRKGTWIHTLIAILRDSTGARIDAWPTSDLTLQIDGVPVKIEANIDRYDEMYEFSGGVSRDTGVIAYTFRNSVQQTVSKADTHDVTLPTTPATLLEVGGTFGTISNAPGSIFFVTGELFPTNTAKIPYTHLAA